MICNHLKRLSVCLFASALLCFNSSSAFAQGLTYVDADDFNSVNLSTSSGDPLSSAIDQFETSTDIGGDNLWRIRGTTSGNMFGASGTVYEAFATEDTQELIQTVGGLSSGTDYDMYAVWWSATTESWTLRAGLSSNPGGNPIYDRTGAFGNAADLGVFTNWDTPPVDNADIVDGFPGIQGATVEGNRVMLVAKVGTATANGSGEVEVFVDDTTSAETGNRTWFDGIAYAPAGATATTVSATIDRTTGNLSLTSTADFSINGVNITSGRGGLDPNEWTSITGNIDGGSGDSSFDSDAWEITAPLDEPLPSATGQLAESEVDPPVTAGAVVGPGGTATLDFGNVWIPSPFEDVVLNLTLSDSGFTVPVAVNYTGGSQILLGDFDVDGDVDVDDYEVVLTGLNQTLTGVTGTESYFLGDMTGNLETNFNDLAAFRDAYDDFNGAGSFSQMIGNVPEPGSVMLLGFAIAGLFSLRRRNKSVGLFAVLLAATLAMPGANAQITYVDAHEELDLNSIQGDYGGWVPRGLGAINSTDTANFGNEGGTLQATEAVEEFATTISIPTAGIYQMYAFFWDDNGGAEWNVLAGLTSGQLTNYEGNDPGVIRIDADTQMSGAATEVFGLNVLGQTPDDYSDFEDGNRFLHAAPVGLTQVANDGDSVSVFIDHDENLTQRTFYDGVGYAVADAVPTLEVNTTTGEVKIKNIFGESVDLSYYEITSASGSLSPDDWSSLDDQLVDAAGDGGLLDGWDVAGSADAALDGDFDDDGDVDIVDFGTFGQNFGMSGLPLDPPTDGDFEPDGDVDIVDFGTFAQNFGETGGGGPGGSPEILNEVNLLDVTTMGASTEFSLGNAFNTAGTQDLQFRFGLVDDGSLSTSLVTYVSGAGAGSAVPEPASFFILLFATGSIIGRRRFA